MLLLLLTPASGGGMVDFPDAEGRQVLSVGTESGSELQANAGIGACKSGEVLQSSSHL